MTSENGRDLDMRLAAAAAVAREAGRLARRYFERRSDLTVEVKGPQDLVSVADRAVEDLIRSRLATLFPEDAVVGEEASGLEQIADDPKDQKREFALKIKDLERRPVHVEPEFAPIQAG